MKNYFIFPVFLLSLFLSAGEIRAEQGCPNGMMPNPVGAGGQPQCIPGQSQQDWSGGQRQSGPEWAKRWGAFSLDDKTGAIGSAVGMTSKRKAEKASIAHCKSKGGANCKPLLAYNNQCAAVAWGEGATIQASGAPTKKEAEERALLNCGKGSPTCEIFFAECSYPERVQ